MSSEPLGPESALGRATLCLRGWPKDHRLSVKGCNPASLLGGVTMSWFAMHKTTALRRFAGALCLLILWGPTAPAVGEPTQLAGQEPPPFYLRGPLSYRLHRQDQTTIPRADLLRVKEFILRQKACHSITLNARARWPGYTIGRYMFYLRPDDLNNIRCDLRGAAFHAITIFEYRDGAVRPRLRMVDFSDPDFVTISENPASFDLAVRDLVGMVEKAMEVIMEEVVAEIDRKRPKDREKGSPNG